MAIARRPKADPDNPELGAEFFSRAKRGLAHVPAPMKRAIEDEQRGRGPQMAPTKEQVTLRLSRDVVSVYRETGKGWQARIDADLATSARRRRRTMIAAAKIA